MKPIIKKISEVCILLTIVIFIVALILLGKSIKSNFDARDRQTEQANKQVDSLEKQIEYKEHNFKE